MNKLLTVEMAKLSAGYIEAIKNDRLIYDRSKEGTLDTVEWEDSYEHDFDVVVPESKKGNRQKQPSKYISSKVPWINAERKKIAIAFEDEATKLGVLNENQKKTKLNFYSYRGAYVRELFKLIADHLQKTKRSAEIDAWREKKYEFHKGYANPRGHGQGPLLTYPRKRPGSSPKSETPTPKILIVDLRTDDEIMHTNSIKKSDDDH